MRCFQCHGPFHPASGNWYEQWQIGFCGACYKPFVKWLSGHLKRKWGGLNFYEHAARRPQPVVTEGAALVLIEGQV